MKHPFPVCFMFGVAFGLCIYSIIELQIPMENNIEFLIENTNFSMVFPMVIGRFYTDRVYHPRNYNERKRHRKWTFQIETKKSWKSELIILKNKKVRANPSQVKNHRFLKKNGGFGTRLHIGTHIRLWKIAGFHVSEHVRWPKKYPHFGCFTV